MTAQAGPEMGKKKAAANGLASSAAAPPFDFHTVTCVTWSASGRNIGVGTTDGFLIYSTEPLLSNLSGACASPSLPCPSADTADPQATEIHNGMVQEICRCVVYGGVGSLSLYKQCSLVAFTGVQRRSAAARIQIADVSRQASEDFYASPVPSWSSTKVMTPAPRRKPWPPEEDAAVAQWYERWRVSVFANSAVAAATTVNTLAFAECPQTVVGLHFCPHAVIAAASGDPNIVGSHTLHVFDHHLNPLYTLPVYPPSSNAYLKDMIAIAATPRLSNGAGMVVQRLRILLPGEKKGEVRLLTFKESSMTTAPSDESMHDSYVYHHGSAYRHVCGDTHQLVDKVLHRAPLRAVAITEDGKSGVTMSEQGMHIRVLDFVGDDKMTNRLTLDRGHLPAVVNTVSLAIVTVPQTHPSTRNTTAATVSTHERCGSIDSNAPAHVSEAVHDIVVCLTSSGTTHIFGCGLQQVLFHHSDKSLLPRVGYPYAFSVCLPPLLVKKGMASVLVMRSDVTTSAVHYLPRHEHDATTGRRRDGSKAVADHAPSNFFVFQLSYQSRNGTTAPSVEAGRISKYTALLCHTIAAL
ncbi:hypothetical protein JKF63_02183 [Porcisia hertigi]|uniref:Uncharacterized protein n=1 Tax=Porcisia hertigi TaxID=2761500 RepID=A0A836IGW3_9TRYP|nr:hypothetical protein JKF63_02183 [Porcisia hertigi]